MHGYDGSKVNLWAQQLRRNLSIDFRLGCVTDHPEGIDSDITIIPMPKDFVGIKVDAWKEKHKLPQCYRRLTIFAPDAEQRFGARRFVSMDLDLLAFSNLDSLFDHDADFRILKGTAAHRPYNGGMVQMTAGARPKVFTTFTEEGAALSRKKFVGSDQAWISHVLGYGEKTWGQREGVYYKRLLNGSTWSPPANMRMLFFPGSPKPWDIENTVPFVRAAYEGKTFKRAAPLLHAYDDPKHWGKWFAAFAKKKGLRCRLFTGCLPERGAAFVRLDQQGPQRAISRQIVKRLSEAGCETLPTAQEAIWYDDKVAQHPTLKAWMPKTRILKSAEEAKAVALTLAYPMISKAAEGAGSANVRVIRDKVEALAEVNRAFGVGIPISYNRRQTGYVYWQDIVPGNLQDYRICIVGEYLYGLTRKNRPGTILASGSGLATPMDFTQERQRQAAQLSLQISRTIGTRWMAYDIVFEGEKPLVLEMSSAWTMESYKACHLYTHAFERTALKGWDSFGVAVDLLQTRMAQAA